MTILPMHDSMSLGSKCPYVLHALSANCYYIYSQKQSWEKGQCKKKKIMVSSTFWEHKTRTPSIHKKEVVLSLF